MTKEPLSNIMRKTPCKKGKHHTVGMFSGICSICGKQIHEPRPELKKNLQQAFGKIDII